MDPAFGDALERQAGNVEYSGIYHEAVRLEGGVYEGAHFMADSAMRPRLQLLATVTSGSNASTSGALRGYALLMEDSGGSGSFLYLAALLQLGEGLYNSATVKLGDRLGIVDF
jgi:hypothetical protein